MARTLWLNLCEGGRGIFTNIMKLLGRGGGEDVVMTGVAPWKDGKG